jgi:hypothetical protein
VTVPTISEREPDVWSIDGLSRQDLAGLACALHEFDRPGALLAAGPRLLRDVLDDTFVKVAGSSYSLRRAAVSPDER